MNEHQWLIDMLEAAFGPGWRQMDGVQSFACAKHTQMPLRVTGVERLGEESLTFSAEIFVSGKVVATGEAVFSAANEQDSSSELALKSAVTQAATAFDSFCRQLQEERGKLAPLLR